MCSLKLSPAPSSSELIANQLQAELTRYVITGETVRCVDHDSKPGVEKDMGDGDQWPAIRDKILAADILVFSTPTWMGHTSSVAQHVEGRLDAKVAETDDGRPILLGKVAIVAVVGNEDGAHHIVAEAFQALNDVGLPIPAQGCTYWNGPATGKTDYIDLDDVPRATASATEAAARNAAQLARALKTAQYPPTPPDAEDHKPFNDLVGTTEGALAPPAGQYPSLPVSRRKRGSRLRRRLGQSRGGEA